jgi:hypothetical protein
VGREGPLVPQGVAAVKAVPLGMLRVGARLAS